MQRADLLQLIEAALAAGQPTYARRAALRHLTDWPGDLGAQLGLARAYAAEGDPERAVGLLETLVAVDPEDSFAQRSLGVYYQGLGRNSQAQQAFSSAHVADGQGIHGALPVWAMAARAAYLAERIGDWPTAQREALVAVQAEPAAALPALLQVAAVWHAGQLDLARAMAESFLARWPRLAALKLCLAECLMSAGEHPRAIALLHDAAAHDAAGQVVNRHWGNAHPYRSLWDMNVSAALPGPLPPELVTMLGINRLGGQAESSQAGDLGAGGRLDTERAAGDHAGRATHSSAEELEDIQAVLDALAARLPSRITLKHRLLRMKKTDSPQGAAATVPQPTYVLISSRTRLSQAYGPAGFATIDAALRGLLASATRGSGMKPCLIYVDDPAALSPYGVRPVNPANAWEVKSLLTKLAARLKTLNASIGAILIVGGGDIIPFHHLPNPTDDADPDIPSDNPYATPDDNYFVPEWPIARLPTGAGGDPAPLLRSIQHLSGTPAAHGMAAVGAWPERIRRWLQLLLAQYFSHPSFGYSANVWRSSSAAVYNLIGNPSELVTSPPLDANALPIEGLAPSRLSYFNLHGIEDGPEWYGQRSLNDPGNTPEYPVALRPGDVANSGRAPGFVFSEACYGANIAGKQTEDALCLKFLDAGSRVVVASTKIAYGSVTTPLIGADLLGRCFWQNVNQGVPAGEALRRAKLQMAQEMHQRQGFLDGEDQKTLIEFVLYGDPLAVSLPPSGFAPRAAKQTSAPPLPKHSPPPVTVCDKAASGAGFASHRPELTPEMVEQIKAAVARYLPGMQDSHMSVARSHADCQGTDHTCPTAQLSKHGKSRPAAPATTVVTLSKTVRSSARLHSHYARVTLDAQGTVIKVAVSR